MEQQEQPSTCLLRLLQEVNLVLHDHVPPFHMRIKVLPRPWGTAPLNLLAARHIPSTDPLQSLPPHQFVPMLHSPTDRGRQTRLDWTTTAAAHMPILPHTSLPDTGTPCAKTIVLDTHACAVAGTRPNRVTSLPYTSKHHLLQLYQQAAAVLQLHSCRCAQQWELCQTRLQLLQPCHC